MAKSKAKAATVATQAAAPAYYHPAASELEAAGFRAGPNHGFTWFQDGPEVANRWHIHLHLLPKSGEVFIYHTKQSTNQPRSQYGSVAPLLTSVASRAEFGALLKRYGWKHRAKPQTQQAA